MDELNSQSIWSRPFQRALLLVAVIFLFDMLVPLGVAVGVLYNLSIFIVIGEKRRSIILMAIIASLLTIIAIPLLHHGEVSWMAYVNRGISVLAIWLSAWIGIKYGFMERKVKAAATIEAKSKELEQFAYATSHDLQEPVRTIHEFSKLLKEEYAEKMDEDGRTMISFIIDASTRMKAMIRGLLDYSRVGKETTFETLDTKAIMAELEQDLGSLIKRKSAKLEYQNLPKIVANKTYFKQLMQNLVNNAMKFSKPDIAPIVKISAAKDKDQWKFMVQDNGIGIAPEHHQKIFGVFNRLHSKSEYPGSGIGLAHCKKIIDMHQGKIDLQSTPGKGTTFYVYLPATLPAVAENLASLN